MENQDSMLVKGFYPKVKHPNAPDFVIAKGSINLPQFAEFMREFKAANPGEEWVNIQNLESKNGKFYSKVDTWKPDPSKASAPANHPVGALAPADDIPF